MSRALAVGCLLWAVGALAQGQVTPAGRLHTPRTRHTATLLADGRVLIIGGRAADGLSTLAACELFDPKTGTWSDAAPMHTGRSNHTATLLSDGRVLVTGGTAADAQAHTARFVALASVELYEPRTNTWSEGAPLHEARNGHSATRLSDGRVLVVGGAREQRVHLGSVELYSPAQNAWAERRGLKVPRWQHEAVRLSDDSVVVVGGRSSALTGAGGGGVSIAQVERYDSATGVWHDVPEMSEPRQRTALVAADDEVIVFGGQTSTSVTNYAERWHPGADGWAPLPNHLSVPLAGHTATRLGTGEVVLIGGEPTNLVDTPRVQVWHPDSGRWCLAGALASSRKLHTATLLRDGRVLVVGGTSAGVPEVTAEAWQSAGGACEEPPGAPVQLLP
jgi:hypothetical protein